MLKASKDRGRKLNILERLSLKGRSIKLIPSGIGAIYNMSKPFSNLRDKMPLSQQLKAEVKKRKELEKLKRNNK